MNDAGRLPGPRDQGRALDQGIPSAKYFLT